MADARWMPATGRRQVDIGPSLRTSLKARKTGTAPPKQSKIPNRDFFAFRYNFKPESVDSEKPGSIDIKRSTECTNVVIERASTKENERHIFKGTELEAKEVECVLIYDEDSGVFTLEKLNSYVNLNHERGAGSVSHINIANHSASPSNSGQNTANVSDDELLYDLLANSKRNTSTALREEEEEEEPEPPAPPQPAPSARRPPSSPPKLKSNPPKAAPKQAAKPTPKPTLKLKTKKEPEATAQAAEAYDSEHLEFGVPSRPIKKRKVSMSAPAAPQEPAHTPTTAQVDSESEEDSDWENVIAAAPAPHPEANEEAEEDEAEELDLDAFNQEMEMQLEGEEAEEEGMFSPAFSPELALSDNARKPISLNQFAGGFSPDEEETSSSEESDED